MFQPANPGIIIVSEPDIYTRERLVNDRFREEYWLRSQLDHVDSLAERGAFDAIQGLSSTRSTATVRLATKGGEVPEATPATDEQRRQELRASQIDRLKDSMAYRDTIRSELMVTQLDDRHDIAGNTLIRLDFDVTVLPAARSAQTALVLIEASGLPLGDMAEAGISLQLYDDWTKHLQKIFDDTAMALIGLQNINNLEAMPGSKRLLDHFILYARRSNVLALKRELEKLGVRPNWLAGCKDDLHCMAELVADRYYAHYRAVLDRLLLQDFYNMLATALEAPIVFMRKTTGTADSTTPKLPPQYLAPIDLRLAILRSLTKNNNQALRSLLSVAIQACQDGDKASGGLFQYDIMRLINYRQSMLAQPRPSRHNRPGFFNYAPPVFDDERRARGDGRLDPPPPGTLYALPCPQSVPEHTASLRTIAALSMILSPRIGQRQGPSARDLLDFSSKHHDSKPRFVVDALFSQPHRQATFEAFKSSIVHLLPPTAVTGEPIDETFRRLFLVFPEPVDYSFLVASFMQERITNHNEGGFEEVSLKTKVGTPLSNFVTTYIDGCETLKCRLSIGQVAEQGGPSARSPVRYCRSAQLVSELKRANFDRKSGDSGGLFVYDVHPKQLVEQYASTVADRRLIGLATEIGAGVVGADSLEAALGILSDTDRQLEALQRHPVVVGFSGITSSLGAAGHAVDGRQGFDAGEGGIPYPDHSDISRDIIEICLRGPPSPTASAEPVAPHRKAPETSSHNPNASFGWIIRPGLDPARPASSAQTPAQRAVSATLSVPTWWPVMMLTVTTCWLDEADLRRVAGTGGSPRDLCRARQGQGTEQPESSGDRRIIVELPTSTRTTAEISRTIGIEVIKEPYLVDAARRQKTLEIGRPGELILEGGRLWKSAMVTLGDYQRADEIIVLPSMEGIIARFNCVRPPPDSQSAGIALSEIDDKPSTPQVSRQLGKAEKVVVWTSEGRTDPVYIELHPFRTFSVAGPGGRERLAQAPCWLTDEVASASPIIPRQPPQPLSPSVFALATDVIRRLLEPSAPRP
jgi:hypothetical protein